MSKLKKILLFLTAAILFLNITYTIIDRRFTSSESEITALKTATSPQTELKWQSEIDSLRVEIAALRTRLDKIESQSITSAKEQYQLMQTQLNALHVLVEQIGKTLTK